MEEEVKETLCRQLGDIDGSLEHILVLLVSVGLSFRATALQRRGLCEILEGTESAMPDVFCLRLAGSLLVIMVLGFFFALAVESWQNSRGGSCRERKSADLNAWAALLVLAAALIRLYDLTQVQQRG